MSFFTDIKEGVEYVSPKIGRVKVTGFARNAMTKENYVMYKMVSGIQSGPHHMVADAEFWHEKGFKPAPPVSESAKLGREGE